MRKLKSKLIITLSIFILIILTIQLSVYATNENIKILKKDTGEYLIYIKDYLNTDFEFAFSNDENIDQATLIYKTSAKDSTSKNANNIAYVDSTNISMFANNVYMWAKSSNGKYIAEKVKIDLTDAMLEKDFISAENITKKILIDTTNKDTLKEEINGKEITKTTGKVILKDKNLNYEYILVRLSGTQDYNDLIKLATIISKFNSNTDMYTKINIYKDFLSLYNKLLPINSNDWQKVENSQIAQPEDAKDGEQYIVWLKNENSIIDIQFLTSYKQYSEEKIVETITTKLPITYDNNILLFILGGLIITIIFVCIRIRMLKNKQEK